MSRLAFLLPNEDDVLGRFLALTLVVYLVMTGFEDIVVLFSAMVIALAIWTVAVTVQGFKYGYLEGKV